MLQYRVIASQRLNSILVERQLHITGENWQTIDRYNTTSIGNLPKKDSPWVAAFVALASQPSAGLEEPILASVELTPETELCKLDTIDITNPNFANGHMMDSIHQIVEKQEIIPITGT